MKLVHHRITETDFERFVDAGVVWRELTTSGYQVTIKKMYLNGQTEYAWHRYEKNKWVLCAGFTPEKSIEFVNCWGHQCVVAAAEALYDIDARFGGGWPRLYIEIIKFEQKYVLAKRLDLI